MFHRVPLWMLLLLALPLGVACPRDDEAAPVDDDDSADDDDDVTDDDDSASDDDDATDDDDAVPPPTLGELAGFHPIGEIDYGGKGPVLALTRTPTSVMVGGQSYVSFIRGFLDITASAGAEEGTFTFSLAIVADELHQESFEREGRITHEPQDTKLVFTGGGTTTVWRYRRIGDALDLTYAVDDRRNTTPAVIHRMRGTPSTIPSLGIDGAWTVSEVVLPRGGGQITYTNTCALGRGGTSYFQLVGSADFDPRGRLALQLAINRHQSDDCSDPPTAEVEVQGPGWFDYDGWAYAHWIGGAQPTSLSASVDAQTNIIVLTGTGGAPPEATVDSLTLSR